MIRHPALAAVRVGCVQYLNSKPLIYGCDAPVVFDHPSGLARDIALGKLDVALVPVFEALRNPPWLAVDEVAIGCDGPVFSVFLAHRCPLEDVAEITLDPASLTSVHLLKVLLAEFHRLPLESGRTPDSLQRPPLLIPERHTAPGLKHRAHEEARLLIGNQAIDFRLANPEGWQYLDLGAEWKRCTGLPFVFALWLMRPTLPNAEAIAVELRDIKYDGIAHISEIVAADTGHTPDVSIPYLTEYIRFGFGPREKAGLAKYRALLERHGLIAPGGEELRFV